MGLLADVHTGLVMIGAGRDMPLSLGPSEELLLLGTESDNLRTGLPSSTSPWVH
jgi:hypothetical protein